MEEIIPEQPEQPEQPEESVTSGETLAEAPNQPNQNNLDIIDTKDITSTYTSTAKPVLNINWDLENPIASEAGLASSGSGNISNTLVTGSFRRSEIDNLLGRNTSVFVSNVTNELFGNGYNAANQISTQQPRPILARKRLIKIIIRSTKP